MVKNEQRVSLARMVYGWLLLSMLAGRWLAKVAEKDGAGSMVVYRRGSGSGEDEGGGPFFLFFFETQKRLEHDGVVVYAR